MIIPARIGDNEVENGTENQDIIKPAFITKPGLYDYPRVDEWVPEEEDLLYTSSKGAFIVPIRQFYNLGDCKEKEDLDYFVLTLPAKRCYASDKMKNHICHYLNYFNKFYDYDKELFMIYSKIKYLIDYEPTYDEDNFLFDIKRYVLSPTMLWKIKQMDEHNYYVNLTYTNPNKAICYTNRHAKLLMRISLLLNMCIPMIIHFVYMRNIENPNELILKVCDMLLDVDIYSDVDLYNKLYETSITIVNASYKHDTGLWEQQDIRSKNVTTHAIDCVENILLNVLPKYMYNDSIINLNLGSINNSNGYQVTGISWEYGFIPLSASNRDEDNNSEFDKYEALLSRSDERLLIQNNVNCESSMEKIEYLYGPFDEEEISHYYRELDGKINNFQKTLVFNLFYKYFGDPVSIKSIDMKQYIKLIIAAKRMLLGYNLKILPYIIGGKVVKLIKKKNINKKESTAIENDMLFKYVMDKFIGTATGPINMSSMIDSISDRISSDLSEDGTNIKVILNENNKIKDEIMSLIATLSISSFKAIDMDEEIDGINIETIPTIIAEEVLMYLLLI